MIYNAHGKQLTQIPSKVGTIFFVGPNQWRGKPYRRKAGGLIVSARSGGKDPTIRRGFWRREMKRRRRAEARMRYIARAEWPVRMSYR